MLRFMMPVKVRFIQFDLALKKLIGFRRIRHSRCPDHVDRLPGRGMADPDLVSGFSGPKPPEVI